MSNLQKAVEILGGVGKLAIAIGEKQPTVSNWKKRGSVPPVHCIAIEMATDGRVTAQDLRPDIFGSPHQAA